MSGSALSPLSIARESDYFTQYLAKAVNCDSNSNTNPVQQQHSQDIFPTSSSSSTSASALQHQMLECLRAKSIDELNKVSFGIEDSFRTSFGPIIDGLLIPTDPLNLMESENSSSHHLSYLHPMGLRTMMPGSSKPPHSLLFGVSRNEAPDMFTEQEERTGIDGLRRDRVLYSFIKNSVDFYQEVSHVCMKTTERH